MNVTAVRLQNFRGFRDVEIELKPITVILGPNSAGKSAFGHALAAMAHAQWLHTNTSQATLSPQNARAAEEWPIDLGQTSDLITDGVTGRVYIALETPAGRVEYGFGGLESVADLRLSSIRQTPPPVSAHVAAKPLPGAAGSKPATSGMGKLGTIGIPSSRGEIDVQRINEHQWRDPQNVPTGVGLDGLLLNTVRHATGTEQPVNRLAKTHLEPFFTDLGYLRASRKRPSRSYERRSGSRTPTGYAGEWTASTLNDFGGDPTTFCEPPTIPETVREAMAVIDLNWNATTKPLRSAVGAWLQHLDLANAVDTRLLADDRVQTRVTLAAGRQTRDVTEVGFGVSQILPVIVGGLLQREESLFVVDLPEAHLHPRPQGMLADFFCAMALRGRYSLIETHSEMFFHRLRLRAAMNRKLFDDIAVYFIDAPTVTGACQQPRPVKLDLDGEVEWPRGFLQEAWEIETQISAVREARRQLNA